VSSQQWKTYLLGTSEFLQALAAAMMSTSAEDKEASLWLRSPVTLA